jgi:hypothetical protein
MDKERERKRKERLEFERRIRKQKREEEGLEDEDEEEEEAPEVSEREEEDIENYPPTYRAAVNLEELVLFRSPYAKSGIPESQKDSGDSTTAGALVIVENEDGYMGLSESPTPIPFRWKYETSKYLNKPPPHLPTCYVCNKAIPPSSQEGGPTADFSQAGRAPREKGGEPNTPNEVGVCSECEAQNKKNREAVADMNGKVALVTGGKLFF